MGYSTKRCPDHDERLWRPMTGQGEFRCRTCEFVREVLIPEGLVEVMTQEETEQWNREWLEQEQEELKGGKP